MLFYITGGVGFALCVLSIILIAILHAKYKPKLIPLILFVVGFVLFLGSGFLFWRGNNLPEEEPVEKPVGTSVDSGLLSTSVTLPAFLFQDEDMSDFKEKKYAEQNDYKKATLNEDGSVTVKMSNGRRKDILGELAAQLEETLPGLINGEKTPYIKSVIWTKEYDEIIITVDKAGYEDASDNTSYAVGMSVVRYQVFNGDYLHSEIIVKDVDTGAIISDVVYPDVWETPEISSDPAEPPPAKPVPGSSGILGNYDVEIQNAAIVTDYDDNPAIVITYAWTNKSEDAVSAEDVLVETAYQDGVQLDDAYIGDAAMYDSELSFKELLPGETFEVQCAFVLASESSVVEFELSELLGSPDDVVSMSFDPSTLG